MTDSRNISLSSLISEALVIAASYRQKPRPMLVIKQNLYNAQRLYDRISTLLPESECALFGADESLRVESIASSPQMTAVKVETMASLLADPCQVVVTCPSALLRFLPFPQDFQKGCISLEIGAEMDMYELKERLQAGGYQATAHIDQPLCYAARGGIIDVFSINYPHPIRVEFFDTEIESIRFFDVATQKTIETVKEVQIVPASDVLFTDEQIRTIREKAEEILQKENNSILSENVETDLELMESHLFDKRMYPYAALLDNCAGIFDYMEDPQIIISDEQLIREAVKAFIEETISYVQEMVQEGKLLPKYTLWHDYERVLKPFRKVKEDPFADNISGIEEVHLPSDTLDMRLRLIDRSERNVLVLPEKEMLRTIDACIENRIPYTILADEGEVNEGISLYYGELMQGFHIPERQFHVYTASELFEIRRHSGRYENKFRSAEIIHSYNELEPGDYIVHAQYGIGQYVGIETRTINQVRRDFLKIVYRGNAELLVPLEQFRLVRKFVSREGVVPRLNKLGSGEWEKTRKKLQENVADIADRLLALYANREQHIGYAFSKDTEMNQKFEAAFPHELTDDQKKAVAEIKKDMESDKPMDRLICGDVGFGKTEVAVIASFKAVTDGKQVAVLCPTTILSAQHYRTFADRYKGYAVNIKVLNRFVPPSEQKLILKQLKEGKVDILIGTHRLLSKDVQFKDLGLLVVDEEQRFGVEHKEKIKELKNGIDVLSLSATPIPRTLQMSLVGIRSLSQLETPPMNRYSVQTYVVEKKPALVIDAIQKELARDGQVFYLYNNIERIYNVARTLQTSLPEARIGVVHGRMDRSEIEDTMLKVTNHELDVLVCTTIVENGIDIPNVNTILIDNAQDFGLAQIYQIKGRVGRSDRIAYAYLLVPPRRQLSEVAQKRLQAVKEFARLGSGYKIAMRDLTIRGAGDLLGAEQSGFIDTVGIDMYIEMLEEAIEAKRTGKPLVPEVPEAKVNIQKTSYIPSGFTSNDYDKLEMYQKIDAAETEDELEQYRDEVIDQYGRLPLEVGTLFQKKQLDLKLNDPNVQGCREIKGGLEITFSPLYSQHVDGVRLFESFTKLSKDISIRYKGGTIIAEIPPMKDNISLAVKVIDCAREAMKK
ncbi:MAG: transcription-repair coupling factor [Erysipelotrichaceae bacterium]|nr:transcription-repair coupling factor [Erysipelotrichaceae bacterium]